LATKQKATIKPVFNIENIVASASLGIELDLYTIASKVPNVEYEPEQFPGAILKLQNPKSSLLVFKNGKVICTGSKSEGEVQHAIDRTLKLLLPYAKNKPPTSFKPTFTIVNIVASAEFGVELELYTIASKLHDVEYEPEQFPGAIFKFKNPKSSLLLFKNGKVICTGSKSEKEVQQSLENAAKLLAPFSSPLPKKKQDK